MSLSRIEQLLAESGLSPEESSGLVDVLAPLDEQLDTPTPTAELAALFEGRSGPGAPAVPMTPRKRALAGVLVLAVSGVSATGLSAAANTLPRPLQHHVSEFSRHYLPFDLPEPSDRQARSAPVPSHAMPRQVPLGERGTDDSGDASRSQDRPGAGAPDASEPPTAAQQSAPTTAAPPSTAPSPSVSASPTPTSSPSSKPASSPTSSPSPPSGAGNDDQGKDRGKDRGQDQGKSPDKGKGPYDPGKDRPRAPGGGNEVPQPGSGEDPGGDSGEAPAPTPDLPLPPLPLPHLPPLPDLPGKGIDVTGE